MRFAQPAATPSNRLLCMLSLVLLLMLLLLVLGAPMALVSAWHEQYGMTHLAIGGFSDTIFVPSGININTKF